MTFAEFPYLHRDYEIIDTWQAGIKLSGAEVKSIRNKHISLLGSFIVEKNHTLTLLKALITPYQKQNGITQSEKTRPRQLLVTKKEMLEILNLRKGGLALLPSKIFSDGIRIVCEIALVKHKTKHDKRETIKQREANRELARIVKFYK